ncbi:MAG: orotidine-5'-phosphate decarboxylase [Austwickia sp.]|nr:orotidine-5'-phosphate decarboxylase [Austwickia sp.]
MNGSAETAAVPSTGWASFGARLQAAVAAHGPLCAGIDPHPGLLAAWGLPETAAGLETFSMRCVEAFGGRVALVKPQSAFFERYGSAGIAVLERTLAGLRDAGTLSLLDAKRGDIGSTMEGYAQAYLSDDSPVRADALTTSPYLGYEALRPVLDVAWATGRGVFVLTLTSNPEGRTVQHAVLDGRSVAACVVDGVRADNARPAPAPAGLSGAPGAPGGPEDEHTATLSQTPGWGSIGMVVGATVGDAIDRLGLDLAGANAPLLAPGLGAQGATGQDVRRTFGPAVTRVLAASSRDVLSAGPAVSSLQARAVEVAERLRDTLRP